jgi:hypothetical protein
MAGMYDGTRRCTLERAESGEQAEPGNENVILFENYSSMRPDAHVF